MSAGHRSAGSPVKKDIMSVLVTSRKSDMISVAIFVLSVFIMATRPMLLYVTGEVRSVPMPVANFQLAVEGAKISICVGTVACNRLLGTKTTFWRGWKYTLQFTPPALMYLVMNLLVVRAARMMNPPTFQLLASTKILGTAVASWVLLRKNLSLGQWFAMFLLTIGVSLGQWNGSGTLDAPLAGIVICLLNGCISATAGVVMERILKSPASLGMTIFETALHTSLHTVLWNGLGMAIANPASLTEFPWPSRLDALALASEATNGILMALLMRRLDSIRKNFAFSTSVFATAGLSAFLLGYTPSWSFFSGAALAGAAGIIYMRAAAPTPPAGSGATGVKLEKKA